MPQKFVIFVGRDLSTAMLLPRILEETNKRGWSTTVVYTRNPETIKSACSALRKFYSYERMALPYIHKVLDEHPIVENALCFSPRGLSEKYNIRVKTVEDVNAPDFLKELESEHFNGALSIRCLQKFSPEFIDIFNKKRFLWNLHSGPLPECRGYMPLFRTMFNRQDKATLTLHNVEKKIDTGDIIHSIKLDINPNHSLLELACAAFVDSAPLILNALEKHVNGSLKAMPQRLGPINHYFSPTPEEVDRFEKSGLNLLPLNATDMIARAYAKEQEALFKTLQRELNNYVQNTDSNAKYLGTNESVGTFFGRNQANTHADIFISNKYNALR